MRVRSFSAKFLYPSQKQKQPSFEDCFCLLGWVKGFEPSISSATNWRFNQLSYTHRMACLKGLEPPTLCLEGRCSIQLSYQRINGAGDGNRTHTTSLEGWDSAIELHPHNKTTIIIPQLSSFVKLFLTKSKKICVQSSMMGDTFLKKI